VYQPAHRKMRPHQTIELLLDQFRRLAPQYDLRPAQMGLEFIERRLDLPALVVLSRQFFGRSLCVVEDGSDQAINRLGAGQIVQVIIDHPQHHGVLVSASVRCRRVDSAEIRAVRQVLVWMQNSVAPGSPKQVRASTGRPYPKLMTQKETVGLTEHALATPEGGGLE